MNAAQFSTEQLLNLISAALKARDFEGVSAALHVLAVRDPHKAELILAMINMAAA